MRSAPVPIVRRSPSGCCCTDRTGLRGVHCAFNGTTIRRKLANKTARASLMCNSLNRFSRTDALHSQAQTGIVQAKLDDAAKRRQESTGVCECLRETSQDHVQHLRWKQGNGFPLTRTDNSIGSEELVYRHVAGRGCCSCNVADRAAHSTSAACAGLGRHRRSLPVHSQFRTADRRDWSGPHDAVREPVGCADASAVCLYPLRHHCHHRWTGAPALFDEAQQSSPDLGIDTRADRARIRNSVLGRAACSSAIGSYLCAQTAKASCEPLVIVQGPVIL